MNILVLVIDRLHAGYLGAYGNSWVETPALDRLASESMVFDQALSFSPDLTYFYRAVWEGLYPLSADPGAGQKSAAGASHCVKPLVDRFEIHGLETKLFTDEPAIAALPAAFGDLLGLELELELEGGVGDVDVQDLTHENQPPSPTDRLCESAEETHLAACFTRLISTLTTLTKPFGFWCHLSSLGKIWDAPYTYRARYAEEGDPEPSESDRPVETILPVDFDPDVLLPVTWSYAANVAVLDECLGALLEYLDESGLADETALILTSPRSYPLGEHRRIGPCDEASYEELVHVPLLIRMPDRTGAGGRSSALVTPLDLFETLADLAALNDAPKKDKPEAIASPGPVAKAAVPVNSACGESLLPILRQESEQTARDHVLLGLPAGDRAIRTRDRHLRLTDPPELYVKPDDRWEANDVSTRLPSEVDALRLLAER